ncbi:MAG: GAF domain-containing protein [Anaerolineae bacterium]|jgi:GAF domain-containing protein|uniref:GAF domain-containing protein n=1 Tax=Candidatus Flexifilum breve TaxID=3140694 RepID=UPI001ACEA0A1|nr:GAF domain-containing protein [Chloroflexota bacterium]MBK9750360.1 GAF domain-containing protein [Chloroflexota bacterium]MBN8638344.1 GAF domain-containing protein [Anaerolineae bacterium]
MPENNQLTTDLMNAIAQTSTEARQLQQILERLMQVLTQNGFQIAVDIVGLSGQMHQRLERAGDQANTVSQQLVRLDEMLRTFALITSSLDLDHVLQEVMDTVIRLTGAERAYLMLKDRNTGELDIAVARNWDRETLADRDAVFSRSIVNQALGKGEAVITVDAAADERFADAKSIMSNQMRSVLCVPLMLHGQVIGVLYADNRITQDVFRKEEIPLLTVFGTQAAIAIENARQFGAVKSDLDKALNELQSLQIEIDRQRVEKQVSQITESDYFQRLSISARSMRKRADRSGGDT